MRYRVLAKRDQGGARQPARGDEPDPASRSATASKDAASPRRSPAARRRSIQRLQEDAREALHVLAGVRHLRRARAGARTRPRATRRSACCTRCTSRSPASSRTTSRSPRPTATSRCTRRCSGRSARRWKRRSARTTCTAIAEAGVAAHWLYKTGGELDIAEAQQQTHRWLQSLLEIQSESRDSKEFLEHIKGDLFPDEIYVFTPKGKIMALPRGATAVDFAYAVHTDIGHHCVAARINYELMPLRTELKNGDQVEIMTSPTARPNPSWLHVRRDRQGALAHPAFPEGAAAAGVGGARRADARAGARVAQGRRRNRSPGSAGRRWRSEYGAKSRLDILADIGLGKRLSFVVAQALTRAPARRRRATSRPPIRRKPGALHAARRRGRGDPVRRSAAGRFPGDAIVGQFRQRPGPAGPHARLPSRCARAASTPIRSSTSSGRPTSQGVFEAGIRLAGRRPARAAGAGSRPRSPTPARTSTYVSMERPDGGARRQRCSSACRCATARHLAHVMRALRAHSREVKRVHRART